MHHHSRLPLIVSIGAIIIVLGASTYGIYQYRLLMGENKQLADTVTSLRASIQGLENNLSLTEYERDKITTALAESQTQADQLAAQTEQLESKVGDFEKLQSLDPELIKKYSKVYFLNEHYTPSLLTDINPDYVTPAGRTLQIHSNVAPYLESMLEAAKNEGLSLLVASAYRSFDTQASLKATYKVTYGTTAANRFSADQGYSEHQLGTTVDLTTASTRTLSTSFDKTKEFTWLVAHAHEYGFVLSYPKNNKYYIYEPWHWRFVGVALATKLHSDKKYLYDVDQREIDEYLGTIFD
jgi:LAS superfamily LD-carboxypeptidase LdcB